jgi:hypothetical protein
MCRRHAEGVLDLVILRDVAEADGSTDLTAAIANAKETTATPSLIEHVPRAIMRGSGRP